MNFFKSKSCISAEVAFLHKLHFFKSCICRQNGRGNPARRICGGQRSWTPGDDDDDNDDDNYDDDDGDDYDDDDDGDDDGDGDGDDDNKDEVD